ncbi:hypothetical protein ACF05W_32565 [Streptomyces lydicus]|uniref:hypothetical protein n=1 Tax=Streptomyces lydicus TaxID=47763 RepID=UPI0036FD3F25
MVSDDAGGQDATRDAVAALLLLEQFGDYVLVFHADRDRVPVFAASRRWGGEAASPDAIGTLIEDFENGGPR